MLSKYDDCPRTLPFREELRFCLSDLRRRKSTSLVMIVSVSVAVIYLLLPAYYAAQLWRQKKSAFDQSLPTRVIAQVADLQSAHTRFHAARLAQLAERPGVSRVRAFVECQVFVDLPQGATLVPARSTDASDPAAAPSRLEWGRAVADEQGRETIVSRQLFRKLGGRIVDERRADPEWLSVESRRTTDGRPERSVVALRIVGVANAESLPGDGLLIPTDLLTNIDQWCAHRSDASPAGDNLATNTELTYPSATAYASPLHAERIQDEAALFDMQMIEQERASEFRGPDEVTVIARRRRKGMTQEDHAEEPWSWPSTSGFELEFGDGHAARRMLICSDELRIREYFGVSLSLMNGEILCRNPEADRAVRNLWPSARCRRAPQRSPYDAVCTESTLRQLPSLDSELSSRAIPVSLLRMPLVQWPEARVALAREGCEVTPPVAVEESELVPVKVLSRDSRPHGIDDTLASGLNDALPTFQFAAPDLQVLADCQGASLSLVASQPRDPLRFQARIIAGGWLDRNVKSIVIPRHLAAAMFPHRPLSETVGQPVRIQLTPLRPLGPDDRLELEFTIAGWSAGDNAFVTLEMARQLELWRHGKRVYRAASDDFVTPRNFQAELGEVRCCIDADSLESVDAIVAWLEAQGYQTDNRLAGHAMLWRLLTALVTMIGALAFGCLMLSIMLVTATSLINVNAKAWEIGALKLLGVSGLAIGRLYVYQGILLGGTGFVVGGVASLAIEPLLTQYVRSTCGISDTLLSERLASPGWYWLFGIACAMSVGSSACAMFLPAWRAARLQPVETLGRRD